MRWDGGEVESDKKSDAIEASHDETAPCLPEDLGNSVREVVGAVRGVNDSILTFRWSGAFHNDAAAKQSRSSHDACPHLSTSYHA